MRKGDIYPSIHLTSRRNRLGLLLDGFFFTTALAFVDRSTLLPALVSELTGSEVLVGLVGSAQAIGSWLPSLFVPYLVAHLTTKRGAVIRAAAVSRLPVLVAAVLLLQGKGIDPWLLAWTIVITHALFWAGDSVAAVPWLEIVSKVLPSRARGRFLGLIQVFGGLGAIAGGFAVKRILGDPRLAFPANYGASYLAASLAFLLSLLGFLLVKEPPGDPGPRINPLGFLKSVPALLRENAGFTRSTVVWLFLGFKGLAVPFYILLGRDVIGFPVETIGVFVSAQVLGSTLGGFAWGYLGDRHGHQTAIRTLAVLQVLPPILAAAAALPATSYGWAYALYIAVYVLLGSGFSDWVPFINYLLDTSDERRRSHYLSLSSLLRGPLALAPLLGGIVVGRAGFFWALALAAIVTAFGAVLSLWLPSTAPRAESSPSDTPKGTHL